MPARERDAKLPNAEAFARRVQNALAHLCDPIYLQTHPLARALQAGGHLHGPKLGEALRQALLAAIGDLSPQEAIEPMRGHRLLGLRYVEALAPEEVQRRLGISRRQYYRDHARAVAALTSLLQERWGQGDDRPQSANGKAIAAALPDPSLPDLPAALTSFIGREREMAEVQQLLGTTRLLTLTGSGGCGKTRLAYEVAAAARAAYPDGLWPVELASLADPTLVPQTVALTLGLREEPGQPVETTLARYLRSRRALLLLDNCEHLLAACAQLVEALLRSCPRLQILVTSREALGLGGETRWRVPSLQTPPECQAEAAAIVGEYEAVRLFVERARAVQPGFALSDANVEGIAQICRRLDGIPLAIELAAALVRVLSPTQIARRLDDRFRLLASGSPTALPRHQTLRATVDWSYGLLSLPERALFRRLAVFAGGWTIEAAEAVCVCEDIDQREVLGLLGQLVDKSLVVVEEAEGESRYRFLETIRQYAQEKLAEAGEVEGTQRRHRDWFLDLAVRAKPELTGREQVAWIKRLDTEHDNVRAALRYCLERDPEAGIRLAGSIYRFWWYGGYTGEGLRWLLEVLPRTGTRTSACAWALTGAGCLTYDSGDHVAALPLLVESLRLFRELGDKPGMIEALRNVGGVVLVLRSDEVNLRSTFEESLQMACEIGDQRGEGFALLFLGRLAFSRREYREALEFVREGLATLRKGGEEWSIGGALWDLVWLSLQHGDVQEAKSHAEEMRRIARHVGDRQLDGFASLGLAIVAQIGGSGQEAKVLLGECLQHFLETGSPGVLDALSECGHLAVQQGDYGAGVRLLAVGESRRTRHGSWRILLYREAAQARWQTSLARAREALGEAGFLKAWGEGEALSQEQALALALERVAD